MSRLKQALTYEDYLALPDDRRYELIEGEICMVPSPGFAHQAVIRNLAFALWEYIRLQDLGVVLQAPMDVVLSSHDVVQPDILFISRQRRQIIADTAVQGPPDLVVEVVSPSNRERDVIVKKSLYARHGIQEYWIVEPDTRTMELLKLVGTSYQSLGLFGQEDVIETPLLPGLRLPVASIFEPM